MKQPAPPSDDPLLGEPEIDFSSATLVVGLRVDSMYVHPELSFSRLNGTSQLAVEVRYPPVGDTAMAAAMGGVGTYAAAVVSARADQIVVKKRSQ